jgi:hypothetical protein
MMNKNQRYIVSVRLAELTNIAKRGTDPYTPHELMILGNEASIIKRLMWEELTVDEQSYIRAERECNAASGSMIANEELVIPDDNLTPDGREHQEAHRTCRALWKASRDKINTRADEKATT